MEETKQSKFQEQMSEKLKNELKKYQENQQLFTAYIKTMDEIDTWLQSGVKNENC